MSFPVVIHHDPDCATSRNVLGIIRAAGYAPVVIDDLKQGWTRPQLLALFAAAGLAPRDALRVARSPAEEMGTTAADVTDDQLLDAMVAHAILVNRPIVCTPNQMRVLGRWMRMLTIPNQSSIPKAFLECDEAGRMRPSPLHDRIVDVMEELIKFILLTRDRADYLVDRYSERKESAEALMKRENLSAVT